MDLLGLLFLFAPPIFSQNQLGLESQDLSDLQLAKPNKGIWEVFFVQKCLCNLKNHWVKFEIDASIGCRVYFG